MTLDNDRYAKGPTFLSNELRYIYWKKYPASPFPDSFQLKNLVVLKLHFSLQKELWTSYKVIQSFLLLKVVVHE